MPDSTQSFTLDEVEKQRILGDLRRSQSQPGYQVSVELQRPKVAKSRSSLIETNGNSNPPIFDCSYSQHFTPTQEDTSSFRQQLDQAPPEEREIQEIDNIFDDELVQEPFQPIETSTALPNSTSQDEPFSAPSPIGNEDGTILAVGVVPSSTVTSKISRTPAISRLRNHETPVGLTQMFQSSQDTPVLQSRKSTYVSMKDSQQGRLPNIEDDDSGEEDPDFPRIRRRSSNHVRSSAAHSIMDRLRERTVMMEDQPPEPGRLAYTSPGTHQENEAPDESVIPASAPVQSPIDYKQEMSSGGSDSIITDSQPQSSEQHTRPPTTLPGLDRGSSQFNETIQFYLPSSYPDLQHEEKTSQPNVDKPMQNEGHNSPSPTRSAHTYQAHDKKMQPFAPVAQDQVVPSPDKSPTLDSTVATESIPGPGHRDQPILLMDTPLSFLQNSHDRTQIDALDAYSPSLHRSASHSLPSITTPVQTSIRVSARSKSVHLPFQTPDIVIPDLSSPVLQAGVRRRSRRPPIIAESPMALDSRPIGSPRKRRLSISSLADEGSGLSNHRSSHDDRPRKRPKTEREVRDSQSLRRSAPQDTPAQPSFYMQRKSATTQVGSDFSHTVSDEENSGLMTSSPLTSLDSEDFMQQESPRPVTSSSDKRTRRVFALYPGTESYYPGELLNSSAEEDLFTKNALVKIKFDDTDEAEIEMNNVRPLDLRIGDVVKVNIAGIKSKQLIINSLSHDANLSTKFTDIVGHTSFEARRKDNGTIAHYTVDQIYLPQNLIRPFLKRSFSKRQAISEPEGPVTPSRRQLVRVRELSPTLSHRGSQTSKTSGVFSGIAFSVTISQPKVAVRDRVERKIASHGGLLMCDGLDQLFEDSPFTEDRDIAPLRLTPLARTLKSAVVIADNPSRRAKYLQALSLGIPCLHFSYIEDCLASKRLLEIGPYMLAAGEGMLGGTPVMLSMTCAITNLSTLTFSKALDCRRQIYAKKQMIIVTGPVRTSRKIHLFLSWAMGCEDLTECHTLEEAHHLMMKPEDGKHWDLISVQELETREAWVEDLKGRLVTNEDVVQSLITGRLCISH